VSLLLSLLNGPESFRKRQISPPIQLAYEENGRIGRHPAGNSLLEGGRDSLRENAQGATLISIATRAFLRQSNSLGMRDFNRIFT
jgi:hypothetical protein